MTLYKLYLATPDTEVFIAEKRGDLKLIADDERHLPYFGALEMRKILDMNPDAHEFRVICEAKNVFGASVVGTEVDDGSWA